MNIKNVVAGGVLVILVAIGGIAVGKAWNSGTPATGNGNATPTPTVVSNVVATASPTPEEHAVSVYMYSQTLFNQPGATEYWSPVQRQTTRTDVLEFVLEEIIKGPTNQEVTQGYAAIFGAGKSISFIDSSSCSGKDFTVEVANERAIVRFCRTTALAGDMSGYLVEGTFRATLKQFPTI